MKTMSHYESKVIQYENSTEMTDHIIEMEKSGWKCTSPSYGKLRARFRRELENE
jgi:hypothetical protein